MKNVLLDFDLIIKAQYDNTFKTGIYYVQYNLIKGLLKKYGDKFNFLAFSYYSENFFNKSINKYLPELKNAKYYNIFSKTEKINNSLEIKIRELRRKNRISKSLVLKIKILFLKLIKVFIPEFKSKKLLNNINIYINLFLKKYLRALEKTEI